MGSSFWLWNLPVLCGERPADVAGISLEGESALEANRRMPPDGDLQPVDVSGDGAVGPLIEIRMTHLRSSD